STTAYSLVREDESTVLIHKLPLEASYARSRSLFVFYLIFLMSSPRRRESSKTYKNLFL
ncbi:palindromic element RPE1 domain-containing protein, partial [Candidatus Rickettsia tasmanensis]